MQPSTANSDPALPWAKAAGSHETKDARTVQADSLETAGSEPSSAKRQRLEAEPTVPAQRFTTRTQSMKPGEFIEVLWILEEDDASVHKWWTAKVLSVTTMNGITAYRIRYEAYKDFKEDEADIVVVAPDRLRHVDKEDELKWRSAGDTSVPTESEAEDGRDEIVTLHELKEDGEELERDIGASIEDASLAHLQENLPMDGQLRVMTGYRTFADFIKQRLRQKQIDEGSEHVVTSADIAEIMQAFKEAH